MENSSSSNFNTRDISIGNSNSQMAPEITGINSTNRSGISIMNFSGEVPEKILVDYSCKKCIKNSYEDFKRDILVSSSIHKIMIERSIRGESDQSDVILVNNARKLEVLTKWQNKFSNQRW